jgi:hypothetical protein
MEPKTTTPALLPVGKRPKCRYCTKELRANFEYNPMPFGLRTDAERKAWRKANPRRFFGTYGGYSDNRFCGLYCGYRYAVRVTLDPLKEGR